MCLLIFHGFPSCIMQLPFWTRSVLPQTHSNTQLWVFTDSLFTIQILTLILVSSPRPPGGFNKFQSEYPEHCETNLDCSCPSSSPPTSVLGLGGLRISSDCSDGESDREPGSATESEGSPLPNNQPAFPVQILPYLFLGCAKDSTNLDVLSKYNIKYILNVTPNLPNMFEHEGDFKYKQIPISDHWSQNLSQFFPEAISFIGEYRWSECVRQIPLLTAVFWTLIDLPIVFLVNRASIKSQKSTINIVLFRVKLHNNFQYNVMLYNFNIMVVSLVYNFKTKHEVLMIPHHRLFTGCDQFTQRNIR